MEGALLQVVSPDHRHLSKLEGVGHPLDVDEVPAEQNTA